MSVDELIRQGEAAGLSLRVEGERLIVRGPASAEAVAKALLRRKAEVVAALKAPANDSQPVAATATLPAWDAAEADRILTQLRADLARIERDQHRGKFHPLLARVLADGGAVAESFIANHEREAAAGWDPMKLLRDCARRLVRTARLEDWKGKALPWERSKAC